MARHPSPFDMTRDEWALLLTQAASWARGESQDPRTQTAAVLLNDAGFELARAANRAVAPALLSGRPERLESPEKYFWIEHSERAALQAAARAGQSTQGLAMGCTLFPCVDCARAIAGCGIRLLASPAPDFDYPRWGAEFRRAQETLEAGGVRLVLIDPGSVA